jgi:hypothetical protein
MTADRVLSDKGQRRDCLLTYIPERKTEVTRKTNTKQGATG